jgi:alpha-methylacyl-CoA racemase
MVQTRQALSGYRILDLSKLLPGPLATLWMAQQGAEVIKVESPTSPDPVRHYPPVKDGVSAFYAALNAGKRSVSVDYRSEDGKEALLRLVESADVVVEQFRPGVMEAFGIGYEVLRKRKPDIILVSITGYGQKGPMAAMPGHDINYLSYSGVLDGLRDSKGDPVIPQSQLADVAGGSMMALNATLTALLHRERTGQGQHVDVSMARNAAWLQMLRITEEQATGGYDAYLSGKLASYNVYRCADGKHVALGALEPKFWQRFCVLVGHPEWAVRLPEPTLKDDVAALFASHPMSHWTALLEHAEVCLSPVLTVQEAMEHVLFAGSGFPSPLGTAECGNAPGLGEDNGLLNLP